MLIKIVILVSDIKVNDEGKLVITKGGADTVLNFSSLRLIESNTAGVSVPPRETVVPLSCNVQPKIIVTYATDNRHLNLYWEQHAFGFEGSTLLIRRTNILNVQKIQTVDLPPFCHRWKTCKQVLL